MFYIYTEYVPDPDIRLVNGSQPNQGRVEIRINGEFGTICDDHFDAEDALVVCRMLGYRYVCTSAVICSHLS